ncbi:fluoride efflux transporter CrcB [Ferviditalea candida]|uniref:Fluoride-specific ion channel FluC n=1 Tax=Ferviditalea candida TaxID=3108399 RepID=A0ABU5ZGN2_9BACL|nr:fluoride efflux transporter CrcB [Paenibacillaceae bacterium T2]
MIYLLIGAGGMVGALLRYFLGIYVDTGWSTAFPLSTLTANYIGCFVLGWFSAWSSSAQAVPVWARKSFATGLIGSFTTFSTFGLETVELYRQGMIWTGSVYVFLSFTGGLLMVGFGNRAAGRQGG